MKPKIREPTVVNNDICAVVFTENDTVDLKLWFICGHGSNHAHLWLKLEDVPSAVEAYDVFNNLFKPRAFEMRGITKSHRKNFPLVAWWNIKKDQFKNLLEDVREKLGEDWSDTLSLIYQRIGKNSDLFPSTLEEQWKKQRGIDES